MTPSGSSAVAMAQLGQTETVAAPNNLNFTDMISNRKPQLKHRELTARCLRLRERCFAPVEFLRGTPLLGCPSQLACRRCIRVVLFQCGQEGGPINPIDRPQSAKTATKTGVGIACFPHLTSNPANADVGRLFLASWGKRGRLGAAMA